MKIGVFGPVFVKININLSLPFDQFSNQGTARTTYSSASLEVAEKLSKDNDVLFFTSLDTEASIPIIRFLRSKNILTDYISYESHGTGFFIQYTDSGLVRDIISYPSITNAVSQMKLHEEAIFNQMDAMILAELDESVIEMCRRNNVRMFVITEDIDMDLEEEDPEIVKDVTIINAENCVDLLKEV